jgi:hypothetical protein
VNSTLLLYDETSIKIEKFEAFIKDYEEIRLIQFNESNIFNQFNSKKVHSISWTGMFSNRALQNILFKAYEQIRARSTFDNEDIESIACVFHHEIAYTLAQKIAFDELIQNPDIPTCYFLPECFSPDAKNILEKYDFNSIYFPYLRFKLYGYLNYCKKVTKSIRNRTMGKKGSINYSYILTHLIFQPLQAIFSPLIFIIFSFFITLKLCNLKIYFLWRNIVSGSMKPLVLITVEDSGTKVNSHPCISIIEEVKKGGAIPVAIVGNSMRYGLKCLSLNLLEIKWAVSFGYFHRMLRTFNFLYASKPSKNLDLLIYDWIRINFISKFQYVIASEFLINQIVRFFGNHLHKTLLTIYEALPLSIAIGRSAKKFGMTWLGFFPILLGDRPDSYYFPADKHLLYGDQLRELMSDFGVNSESMTVTGTPTYDLFVNCDRDVMSDPVLLSIQANAVNKKIIVVLTEAFSDGLVEIGPILNVLCKLESILVVLKLHPSDNRDYYLDYIIKNSLDKKITLIQHCKLSELFSLTFLIIGVISNVIISASISKVPTLICDFSGKTKVLNFHAEGICPGCFEVSGLEETITKLTSMAQNELKEYFVKNYWKLERFNGPNDGKSAQRVSKILMT